MVAVRGLSDAEQDTLNRLVDTLKVKRRRNQFRSALMDGKHVARRLPPTVPEYIRTLGIVLGWPAKAVESLARRAKLDGFVIPGMDLETFGLDSIIEANNYIPESRVHHLGSLEHGPTFLVTSRGGAGEPEVVITRTSALNGTGSWNVRTRRLDDFLSVFEWENDDPLDFNIHFPTYTAICSASAIVDRVPNRLPRIAVEPLVYKARDGRPFGSSRITRAIISHTQGAIRTLQRSEGTADFYSAPIIALLGADEATFGGTPRLRMLMSAMFGVPDDENAPEGRERVDLKQINQASQEPHVKSLEFYAQLFAAEANLPLSSLGIGATQANPTSAESYVASREDLIDEAEDAADGWSVAHVRTLQNAWMLAEGESSVPSELSKLRPIWRDPRHPSRASEADWLSKVVPSIPWLAETDTVLDLIGVRPDVADRLRADRARVQGRATLRALAGGDAG